MATFSTVWSKLASRKGEAAVKDKDKESLGSIELVSGAQLYPVLPAFIGDSPHTLNKFPFPPHI